MAKKSDGSGSAEPNSDGPGDNVLPKCPAPGSDEMSDDGPSDAAFHSRSKKTGVWSQNNLRCAAAVVLRMDCF